MKQEGLSSFTDTYLTSLGLLIFILFFFAVIIWINRKGAKAYYEQMEKMPLNDGDISHERF